MHRSRRWIGCQPSTWWIRVTPTPTCWSTANASMASPLSVQLPTTRVGRLRPAPVSRRAVSSSTETAVVRFSRRDCSPCPVRSQCTRRQVEPRELVLQPRVEHEALQAARRHQQTEDFKVQYAARAGIEGTHAQAVRRAGLRRSRYIGLAKTRLQHIATAAALNLVRINEWCSGTPLAKTRI